MISRLFLALTLLCVPDIACADELLEQGLNKMAVEINKFLAEENLPAKIVVGDFKGVPELKASGGVEISRQIAAQLQKAGIEVADKAGLQLKGEFKLAEKKQLADDNFESLALEISATVLDGNGEELAELPISVFGSVALQIAGQTVDLPPNVPEQVRQGKLIEQVKKPSTKIVRTQARPSSASPFAIEVLVRNGNQLSARSPKLDSRSLAFIELHKGEEYVVRLFNYADFEAGVTLTIDGVDMFVDAADVDKRSRIIVLPGKHVDIPGWFISKTQTKAFKIGGYEESIAKRVGHSTSVGTISASFRACWNPNGTRPNDEPGGTPKGGKATTQGRDIEKNYQQVVRDFGDVRAVVSVRYDQ